MKKYLFILPLFLSFFIVNNSFALQDLTFTYDADHTSNFAHQLCNSFNNSPVSCDGYKYLYFTPNFDLAGYYDVYGNTSPSITYQVELYGSTHYGYESRLYLSLLGQNMIYAPNSFKYVGNFSGGFSNLTTYDPDWSITVTLSENNPFEIECPEPEEPEPCPVVPETPYHDDLQSIKLAIYTCGAVLIVLYFFYCIYRMIIKGVN